MDYTNVPCLSGRNQFINTKFTRPNTQISKSNAGSNFFAIVEVPRGEAEDDDKIPFHLSKKRRSSIRAAIIRHIGLLMRQPDMPCAALCQISPCHLADFIMNLQLLKPAAR